MSALTNLTGPNTPEAKQQTQAPAKPVPLCAQKMGSAMNALKRLGPYREHRARKPARFSERTEGAVLSIRGVEG